MIDPIPLPAPVWLLKFLHMLLLTLHFGTIHLMLGSLLIATIWNWMGNARKNEAALTASNSLAGYLPVLMTYLINFGIPPLLFAQLMYGIALYTSTVIIGGIWISVIFLLMGFYYILYLMGQRGRNGKAWWGFSLFALLIGMSVAKIYNMAMTLMIRPEVWREMYRTSAHGVLMPSGDPTMMPRWLFMLIGSVAIAGVGLVLMGQRKIYSDAVRRLCVGTGGLMTLLASGVWAWSGFRVFQVQPAAVMEKLMENVAYKSLAPVWLIVAGGLLLLGLFAFIRKDKLHGLVAALLLLVGILAEAVVVILRDGIRDVTLLTKGFDVWSQEVCMNLGVVVLFIALLVFGLILIVWLCSVLWRAKPASEAVSP